METAPHRIFMCRPDFFRIDYVINPWMAGNLNRSRPLEAARQWANLRALVAEEAEILELEPAPACPDMVFTANAGLVLGKIAVPSRFLHAERRAEEPHFTAWFAAHGFDVHQLPPDLPFEGAGDALLDRANPWLWAGYGMRTELQAHGHLERILGMEVLSLRLVNPRFYHLDTCFCPLEGGVLLYYPPAFDTASLRLIESRVPAARRIALGETDALNFACNAVNLGQTVIVNRAGAV